MRTIKFRGILKSINRIVYGSLCDDAIGKTEKAIAEYIYRLDDFFRLVIEGFIDPATVEQCIDLKDKNGVDLYEGDEIKLMMYRGAYAGEPEYNYENFVAVWEQEKMRFGLETLWENKLTGEKLGDSWAFDASNDMEIIGKTRN